MTNENFDDIAPYDDSIFPEKLSRLVEEKAFKDAVKFILPDLDYSRLSADLLSIRGKEELQLRIMLPVLEQLAGKFTTELKCAGLNSLSDHSPRVFITNHRDIVLDSAFLNLCFIRAGLKTSEIAIGNNLLIYPWIENLVRLNKSFIVHRNIKAPRLALAAAEHLSAYIHYTVEDKKQSIWIAQREGRAKDSSDKTQESLIKMMTLAGDSSPLDKLSRLHITPTCLSYEFDPNDYLKAREFLLKSKNPDYCKTQRDDLLSMETGLFGSKGRVNISVGDSITEKMRERLTDDSPRSHVLKLACQLIDHTIHSSYHIYPVNYIAYDHLDGTNRWRDLYTTDELKQANEYWEGQLQKLENKEMFTSEDFDYMRRMMWTMYANPLRNKLLAVENK